MDFDDTAYIRLVIFCIYPVITGLQNLSHYLKSDNRMPKHNLIWSFEYKEHIMNSNYKAWYYINKILTKFMRSELSLKLPHGERFPSRNS